MLKKISLCLLLFTLTACGGSDFTVLTEFAKTQDVATGTVVYLGEQEIGEVKEVVSTGEKTTVEIALKEDAIELLSSNSAVVINRLKQGTPIEIYNQTEPGEPLQNGQSLTGLDSMFQLGAWMVGDAIKVGTNSVTDYIDAFQDYLKSEKFEQDKQKVQKQINSAQQSANETIEAVNSEVNRVINDLAELEEPAAQAIEQLGEELSPVVEELAKSGSQVIQELEKLTSNLEQAQQQEQQAGETFLISLLEILEKLNNSMQTGLQQSEESAEQAETQKTEPEQALTQ